MMLVISFFLGIAYLKDAVATLRESGTPTTLLAELKAIVDPFPCDTAEAIF